MIAYTATVVRTIRPGSRRPTILMLGRIWTGARRLAISGHPQGDGRKWNVEYYPVRRVLRRLVVYHVIPPRFESVRGCLDF